MEESSPIGTPVVGKDGKRPRGDAPAAALAVDVSAVHGHAQWWNPATQPQKEAPPFFGCAGF